MKKELLYFYLPGCPYCRNGDRALEKLLREPEFASVTVRRIDETRETELADSHDYWYVPCLWDGDRKLYEAHPGESAQEIETALRNALKQSLLK